MLKVTSVVVTFFAWSALAHGQVERPLTHSTALECAGALLTIVTFSPKPSDNLRRVLSFYQAAASVLEAEGGMFEASASAGRASNAVANKFVDAIDSKSVSAEERTAAMASLQKVTEMCTIRFRAHLEGLSAGLKVSR